jgi:hypothetical protein
VKEAVLEILRAVARVVLGVSAALVYYSTASSPLNGQQLSFGLAVMIAVIVLLQPRSGDPG